MATICYTRNGVKKSLLSLTEKITTPSIKIVGPGGTFYTPLFNSTAATVDKDRYRYTLTNFKVGSYRAAESRAWINRAPVIRLLNYPAKTNNGTGITFTIEYSDEDNDNCTIEYGCQRPYYGNIDNVKTGSMSVSTSSNAQSVAVSVDSSFPFDNESYYSVYAKITDPSGASAIATAKILKKQPPRIIGRQRAEWNNRWVSTIAPYVGFSYCPVVENPDGGSLTFSYTSNLEPGPSQGLHSPWYLQYDSNPDASANGRISVICKTSVDKTDSADNTIDIIPTVSDGYTSVTAERLITRCCMFRCRNKNYVYLVDYHTRYTGAGAGVSTGQYTSYYQQLINGLHDEGGKPYLYLAGFEYGDVGKTVDFRFIKFGSTIYDTSIQDKFVVDTSLGSGNTAVIDWTYRDNTNMVALATGEHKLPFEKPNNCGSVLLPYSWLPYGEFTIVVMVPQEQNWVKIYAAHVSNRLTGHGNVDE